MEVVTSNDLNLVVAPHNEISVNVVEQQSVVTRMNIFFGLRTRHYASLRALLFDAANFHDIPHHDDDVDDTSDDHSDEEEILDDRRKTKEKPLYTEEEETMFWTKGLLGTNSAESLVNTVYFYCGKLFGLRANEQRLIRISNIIIRDNFIIFDESVSETFHGG